MHTSRKRSSAVTVLAVTVLSTALAAPALASPSDVVVTAGSLGLTAPSVANFTGVTLDGAAETTTAAVGVFTVIDSTGSGSGWNVTVQASQMAQHDGTGYVAGGRTLPAGGMSLSAPSVTADGTSSPTPTVSTGPYTIDGGSAVKIASAATGEGMGTYDFGASTITLAVPANAYAKTYRSDITVSLVSGP